MKISEIYNLNKTQWELDFVNIDIDKDKQLFIDPYFLSIREDTFSISCTNTITSFMKYLVDLIRKWKKDEARDIFTHFNEPNETCLWMSVEQPVWKWIWDTDANKIFDSIYNSRGIQTWLLKDIEDSILFVPWINKDKISDMTTNLIKMHLIEYTQKQCELHWIKTQANITTWFFRDWIRKKRDNTYTNMLVIWGKKIILVPKWIVSFARKYTPGQYYNKFVLEFLKNDHLKKMSHLVQYRGDDTPYVTKKSVRWEIEDDIINMKEFLLNFSKDHPDVLDDFKEKIWSNLESLDDEHIDVEIVKAELWEYLIWMLQSIEKWRLTADDYHNIIVGIIQFVFYPDFIYPKKETPIHWWRKRIDITYENAAKKWFLDHIQHKLQLPCPHVFVECKNFTWDPANPELDQLSWRFSPNRWRFWILTCRDFSNTDLFIERCRDTYSDNRWLIVPLTDVDLVELINMTVNDDKVWKNRYVQEIINKIVLS